MVSRAVSGRIGYIPKRYRETMNRLKLKKVCAPTEFVESDERKDDI